MKLQEIVEKLLKGGIFVEMSYDNQLEVIKYDLNTGMKSHCHLYEKDGVTKADMRYDETAIIEDYEDILSAVVGCLHSRGYLNCNWHTLLSNEGYDMDKILKSCIF